MSNTKTYKATIEKASRELTAKEKILIKDTSDAISFGDLKEGESLTIKPSVFAKIHITNSASESGEYDTFVIIDDKGVKYTTSSDNFMETFGNLMDDLEGCEEDYAIKVYTKPSKNYKGKFFLTCGVV